MSSRAWLARGCACGMVSACVEGVSGVCRKGRTGIDDRDRAGVGRDREQAVRRPQPKPEPAGIRV